MNRRFARWKLVPVVLAAALSLAACGGSDSGGGSAGGQKDKTITIGTLSWEESLAVTAVWKNMLEAKGYKVEVKQLDAGPAYQALSTGQIDVFPEQWPNYFKSFMQKYKADIKTVGTWYEGTDINLAVPDYVTDVNSLSDLPSHADEFGGKIVGIESGSETMKLLKSTVAPGYGLDKDYKIQASSTPAMLAAVDDAIKNKDPILVTLWRPHWAFSKYPLKALKDPDELFGGTGVIQTVANKDLSGDHPEVTKMLSRFKLDSDQLGALELEIQAAGKGNTDAGAKKWMAENKDLVASWAP